MPQLSLSHDRFAIDGVFRISRDAQTSVDVVKVSLTQDGIKGHGECRPYSRYNETPQSVMAQIENARLAIEAAHDVEEIQSILPPGAARNAVDCAFWDLECKKQQKTIWQLLNLTPPKHLQTAFTLGIDTPEAMAEKAVKHSDAGLLKVKLGSGDDGDSNRLQAIRNARPDARLIVDANEGWTGAIFDRMMDVCVATHVELIEQPIPAGEEHLLSADNTQITLCADESLHTSSDLEKLRPHFNAINIKLDKAGGLTESLKMVEMAKALDFKIMAGCMLATSLAMAPAYIIGAQALVIDLDGPLLLAEDRAPSFEFDGTWMKPPSPHLWG